MRPNGGRRLHGDGGAVLVEAAFVLPIVLTIVLGLFDVSVWEFQRSQASSAARDGARAGVVLSLAPGRQAATKTAIVDAVRAKIPDPDRLESFAVSAWCEGGTATTDFSGCSPAVPGTTRLIVRASWRYEPVSFVGATFGTPTISSTAEMVWTGPRQSGGTAPPPSVCSAAGPPAVPVRPNLSGNPGSLGSPGYVEATFPVADISLCTDRSAQFVDGGGSSVGTTTVQVAGNVITVRATPSGAVPPGSYSINLTAGGRAFTVPFTLDTAAACSATIAAPTPLSRQGNGGNLTGPVTGAVTLTNCSGTWTIELVRVNGSTTTLFQSVTSTQSGSFNVSFPGQKNSNNSNLSFETGTYRILLRGGNLNGTVSSNDITVN